MMLYPSRTAFLEHLQDDGVATVTITASDDLAVVIPSIITHSAQLGVEVRVFRTPNPDSLMVVAK